MITEFEAGAADLPLVVQHSWGTFGGGGPIGALARIQDSRLSELYRFVPMHQEGANGGIDFVRLREWVMLLRDIKPDLVHVRGLGNEGFHGALAARLAGCKRILVSVHGTQRDLSGPLSLRRRLIVQGLEPATLRMATHVAAVCRFGAERPFMQRYDSKIVGPLINGVRLDSPSPGARAKIRAELEVYDQDVVVVSVGRLSLEKGHGDLAQALEGLPVEVQSSMVLVVVGDGPDSLTIEKMYGRTRVRFRMLGRRLDVSDILDASDVFVFPSWHENLSNALLEGMSAGLPVVATRVGGNVEVLEQGGGILISRKTPQDLGEALTTLINDRQLCGSLGRSARHVVESGYSHEAMLDSVERVYGQILFEGCRG